MTQILPFKSIPLRLDIANERLLRGQQEIPLTPKGFALLHYLVMHRDNLVTKQTLLDHVWPDVYVVEEALRYQIKELRIALGDNAQTPQFIETVRGRGYRFIGSITIIGPSHVGQLVTTSQSRAPSLTIPPGRAADIATLQQWLTQAETGERRLGFISGEPGIGKTTLLNAFLDGLHDHSEIYWLGCGRCVEFYGLNEAYLPLLDALEQLCRGEQDDLVISELDRYAPSWLLQLPEFVTDRASLERRVQGSGRERMLREFAQLLEALSQHKTLVLSLEDLHWADNATLEQLAYLAQRTQTAKLLVIGSYRPVDAYTSNQALVKLLPELSRYPHCNEHPLDLLNEAAVCDFIHRHYPGLSNEFAKLLQRRSGGNPLFMHNIIDYLQAHDWIVRDNGQWQFRGDMSALELELPVAIRQLIERRLSQLDDEEQTLLKTASAAGFTFASEALAVGLNWQPEKVEHRCEQLVQRAQFLGHSGEEHWPDGSVTARYEFIHALYQETLYKRLTPTSRTKLHQRMVSESSKDMEIIRSWWLLS